MESDGVFLLACPVVIRNLASLYELARDYQLNIIPRYAIACTAMSPSTHNSEVVALGRYAHVLIVAFSRLQYPDDSLFKSRCIFMQGKGSSFSCHC